MRQAAAICVALLGVLDARAQGPSASLLVLNKTEATLSIIDPASGRTVGRVPTGDGPHEVAVSADGRLAFVRVVAIDLQKMDIVQTIATGAGPDGMAWVNP